MYFVDDSGRGIRYHNDPEKTAAAHLVPGTFTLGDVGHVGEDGYLYITGRVTDMVISGGVNIYPAECERILADHPAVTDVALFGIPDDEMGEQTGRVGVPARIQRRPPTNSSSSVGRSIAGYKVPRHLVVVPEVPRSPMGKVDKRSARDAYLAADASSEPRGLTAGRFVQVRLFLRWTALHPSPRRRPPTRRHVTVPLPSDSHLRVAWRTVRTTWPLTGRAGEVHLHS